MDRFFLIILMVCMVGCMVGPKYHKPETCMPTKFEECTSERGADEDLCQWWKQFQDPVLDCLICEALENNYDLRIAVEKIYQARAQFRVENSRLWPEFDFIATAIRNRISQNLLPPPSISLPGLSQGDGIFPTNLNIFQVGFDAIWELDFWGKFRHSRNAAYYNWEATSDDAISVMISMLSEVAVNYVNIRALQQKIDLTKKKIEADEQELRITQDRFKIGLDNEIQVNTLLASIASDKSSLPALETTFKQTVYALAYLLGRQPEGFIDIFQEVMPIPSGIDRVPVGLPSDLLRRRPDVRSAERQLAAATENVGVAVAELFPHIMLTGFSLGAGNRTGATVGLESAEFGKLFKWSSRIFSIGGALYWNVFDFGKRRGNIAIQNSLARQAFLNYEQTVLASLQDVEGALTAYFEEQKQIVFFTEKVDADRRTYDITQSLYKIGLANESQVLQARKTLLVSENSLIDSRQSLVGDLIALYKAIGGNWTCP